MHPTELLDWSCCSHYFPLINECLSLLQWLIKNSNPLFQMVPTLFSWQSALCISFPTLKGLAGNPPACWAPSSFPWVSSCSPGRFWEGAVGCSCVWVSLCGSSSFLMLVVVSETLHKSKCGVHPVSFGSKETPGSPYPCSGLLRWVE